MRNRSLNAIFVYTRIPIWIILNSAVGKKEKEEIKIQRNPMFPKRTEHLMCCLHKIQSKVNQCVPANKRNMSWERSRSSVQLGTIDQLPVETCAIVETPREFFDQFHMQSLSLIKLRDLSAHDTASQHFSTPNWATDSLQTLSRIQKRFQPSTEKEEGNCTPNTSSGSLGGSDRSEEPSVLNYSRPSTILSVPEKQKTPDFPTSSWASRLSLATGILCRTVGVRRNDKAASINNQNLGGGGRVRH